jgi:hypothetical protein
LNMINPYFSAVLLFPIQCLLILMNKIII